MKFSDIKFNKMEYYSDNGLVHCGWSSDIKFGDFVLSIQCDCTPQQELDSINYFRIGICKTGFNDYWVTQDFVEGKSSRQSRKDIEGVLEKLKGA